ncbi:ABC transporter ATP-binding protein [Sphingorhabdus sp. SMR4y]|uniref:ABC transporter ATP-binding protein n=1 Tax=Sphingorhabdus sp. SMR4y TaxID=2584094 RepID=UPI000B5CAD95|nr:ABC transporter ATP-binding protein [Sphingorhabdus sp. SMR4y]ASK89179.1 glutamine ABC transporter ATP-binding protein [Sphingorhabdus sp. SMR4y]
MKQSGEKTVLSPSVNMPSRERPFRLAFALLTPRERRNAFIVLAIFLVSSVTLALSVASVYPFLLVLTRPDVIQTNAWLQWGYQLVGSPPEFTFILLLGGATIALLLINAALQVLRVYMIERFTQMRIHTISVRLLEVFMSQPMTFFLGRNTGDMAKGILNETREVVQQYFRPGAELAAGVLGTLSVIIVLMTLAPMITLVALGVIVVSYAIVYLLSRTILGQMGVSRVKANSERYRISREALSGIKDIKIAGTEKFYLSNYSRFSSEAALTQSRANVINSAPRYMVEAVIFVSIILLPLVYFDEETLINGGLLTGVLPELGIMALGAQRLLPEVQKIYRSISVMKFGAAAVTSVHTDMIMPVDPAMKIKPSSRSIRLDESLELRNVHFAYPTAEGLALNGINLKILKGQRIGIVGTTGAGKSTLADLVLGLLRPRDGDVLVDGVRLADEDIRIWQKAIGYVPQHIFLSDATVAENIALGAKSGHADQSKIEEAARIAQLHEFITAEMPQGYDTSIGENGVRLSGGQRQRIGIARALYRDADLIVFDEATSALDSVTEGELVAAIDALPGEKTLLVIAHRLTTVKSCDRIIVMKQGRIVASGNWEENLRDSPEFRDLVAQKSD